MQSHTACPYQHAHSCIGAPALSLLLQVSDGLSQPVCGRFLNGCAVNRCLHQCSFRHRAPRILPVLMDAFESCPTDKIGTCGQRGEGDTEKRERVQQAACSPMVFPTVDFKDYLLLQRIRDIE